MHSYRQSGSDWFWQSQVTVISTWFRFYPCWGSLWWDTQKTWKKGHHPQTPAMSDAHSSSSGLGGGLLIYLKQLVVVVRRSPTRLSDPSTAAWIIHTRFRYADAMPTPTMTTPGPRNLTKLVGPEPKTGQGVGRGQRLNGGSPPGTYGRY